MGEVIGYIQPRRRQRRPRRNIGQFAASMFLLFAATNYVKTAVAQRAEGEPAAVVAHLTVGQGDTLWQIAEKYGSPRQSIQETVCRLREANNMKEGQALQPGDHPVSPIPRVAHFERRLFFRSERFERTLPHAARQAQCLSRVVRPDMCLAWT